MVRKQDKSHREKTVDIRDVEIYVCSGHFHTDFTEMCRRNEMVVIPLVVLRPIPPCDAKPEKVKGKHHAHSHSHSHSHSHAVLDPQTELLDENGEPIPPPPKTYTVKDSFEYFKPNVQVNMDHPDKQDTVTEIFVRGWKIDPRMMEVFKQCWPLLQRLHSLNLWHVGLTGDVVSMLAALLPVCTNVRNLMLNGNTLKEENWHELIAENSLIQKLSLKHCCITDKGVAGLAKEIGTLNNINNKLISLDLFGNRITDVGCEYLAKALRLNRTLLVLSLGSNDIGDVGCCKLAEVLSTYVLTHEEVVERRKQLRRVPSKTTKFFQMVHNRLPKMPSKHEKESPKSKKEGKGKHGHEDGRRSRREERAKKHRQKSAERDNQLLNIISKLTKSPKASSSVGSDGKRDRKRDRDKKATTPEQPEMSPIMKVLLKITRTANYQLWVTGNRVLISLNLCRNKISTIGVKAMLKAVQQQIADTSPSEGTGLLRLVLHKNLVPPNHDLMIQLENIMVPRDPHYKPPVSVQEEASSSKTDAVAKKKSSGSHKDK